MQLYHTDTSPYARKVRMVAIEKGLGDRLQLIVANPFDDGAALLGANPLNKVPALVTDDGAVLYDSPVICAWLDTQAPTPRLIPEGPARWEVLVREALADGIMDAAFAMTMEMRRPQAQQSADWIGRWTANIRRAADAAEADLAGFEGEVTLAQIALGAALAYLDFRQAGIDWRAGRPGLAGWYERFAARAAMRETAPPSA